MAHGGAGSSCYPLRFQRRSLRREHCSGPEQQRWFEQRLDLPPCGEHSPLYALNCSPHIGWSPSPRRLRCGSSLSLWRLPAGAPPRSPNPGLPAAHEPGGAAGARHQPSAPKAEPVFEPASSATISRSTSCGRSFKGSGLFRRSSRRVPRAGSAWAARFVSAI